MLPWGWSLGALIPAPAPVHQCAPFPVRGLSRHGHQTDKSHPCGTSCKGGQETPVSVDIFDENNALLREWSFMWCMCVHACVCVHAYAMTFSTCACIWGLVWAIVSFNQLMGTRIDAVLFTRLLFVSFKCSSLPVFFLRANQSFHSLETMKITQNHLACGVSGTLP